MIFTINGKKTTPFEYAGEAKRLTYVQNGSGCQNDSILVGSICKPPYSVKLL